ncbi:MAG: PP2C family protein-serine/threonine phosphatase [Chlamydiales bacterium]|nr:PP2C family protein-serine/threonine phosphatase [Chlamydiales bacterium]
MISGHRGLPPEPINPQGVPANKPTPPPVPPRRGGALGRVSGAAGAAGLNAGAGSSSGEISRDAIPPSGKKLDQPNWFDASQVKSSSKKKAVMDSVSRLDKAPIEAVSIGKLKDETDAMEAVLCKKGILGGINFHDQRDAFVCMKRFVESAGTLHDLLSKIPLDRKNQAVFTALGGKLEQLKQLLNPADLETMVGNPFANLLAGQQKDNVRTPVTDADVGAKLNKAMSAVEGPDTKVWKGVSYMRVRGDAPLSASGGPDPARLLEAKASDKPLQVSYGSGDNLQSLNVGCASVQNPGKSATNEDRFDYGTLSVGETQIPYTAVFDGHGGPQVADLLSKTFHEKLQNTLKENGIATDAQIYNALDQACIETNEALRNSREAPISGACGTMSIIVGDNLWVASVGDTRAIVVGNNATRCLTEDADPMKEPYNQQVRDLGGQIGKGPKGDDRLMDVNGNFRIQTPGAFGDCSTIGISAHPQITKIPLSECGDGFCHMVIGCDGLFDIATNTEVGDAVRLMSNQGRSPSEIARNLACKSYNGHQAYNKLPDRPPGMIAGDDVTAVVVRIPIPSR